VALLGLVASEKDVTSRNHSHALKKRTGRIPCAQCFNLTPKPKPKTKTQTVKLNRKVWKHLTKVKKWSLDKCNQSIRLLPK